MTNSGGFCLKSTCLVISLWIFVYFVISVIYIYPSSYKCAACRKVAVYEHPNSRYFTDIRHDYSIVTRFGSHRDKDFFAIYDQYGSRDTVEYVKDNLYKVMSRTMNAGSYGHVDTSWEESYITVDKDIAMKGKDYNSICTSTSIIVRNTSRGKMLHVANIGDTSAILVSSDESITKLTQEHIPTEPGEYNRIIGTGGKLVRGKLEGYPVSRAFGGREVKHLIPARPFVLNIEITNNDTTLVIASGALWKVLSITRVANLVRQYNQNDMSCRDMAYNLCNEAVAQRAFGRVTALVAKI